MTVSTQSKTSKMSKMSYQDKALMYAERYGIIDYRVEGKYIIWNQNYTNSEFMGGKWMNKPFTIQAKVNLDNYKMQSRKLQKLQRNGWNNG